MKSTGGGPPIEDSKNLTEEDLKILGMLGTVVTEGHSSVKESACEFNFENTEEIIIYDHDYCMDMNMDNHEENQDPDHHNTNNDDKDSEIMKQTDNSTKTKVSKKCNKFQRLDNSISANKTLIEITEKDVKARKSYHSQKLALYKRDVEAKEKIAKAVHNLANHLINKLE